MGDEDPVVGFVLDDGGEWEAAEEALGLVEDGEAVFVEFEVRVALEVGVEVATEVEREVFVVASVEEDP